ncbi:MAG TPA: hypothetical protein VHS34_02700 [Terriglobales bacterium]|nr:hypothetical protein [Terriglobales bacterium]
MCILRSFSLRPPGKKPKPGGARAQTFLKILASALLVGALCVSALRASAQDQQAGAGDTIRGTVLNSLTREPISKALVYSPDNRFAAMTDDQGRFEFAVPQAAARPPGAVLVAGGLQRMRSYGLNALPTLTARKPGFLSSDSGQVENSASGSGAHDVTILLTPEALIVGRVVLPTSEPPDRITVEIYRRQIQNGYGRWASAGETQTKSSGEFRFSELPAGEYKLFTHELMDSDSQRFPGQQPYGYAPVYFPNVGDFGSAAPIELTAGKTFQAELSLARQPYYPVKVGVAGVPPGFYLDVEVWAQGRRGPGYSLGFNQQDQTAEGLLPNGTYTLQVAGIVQNMVGQNLVSGSANITVHGAAFNGSGITVVPSRPIMVNVKEEFTAPDATSPMQMVVGSHLFTVRGPRSYLTVMLEPADDFGQNRGGGSLRPASGPQDETLAIDNTAPGRYWVRINSARGYVSSATSGGTDLLHEPLVVGPGGASPPIEVTMRDDTADLEGIIEGAPANSPDSNQALAYVYCIPLSDSPGQFAETGVSPDGKFNLQTLAPGVYRVLAFKRQRTDFEYLGSEGMQAYDAKGPVVRLVAGQKEYLHLRLLPADE